MGDDELKAITLDGEYETRDGRAVRIYCVDAGGLYPVHGAVEDTPGNWASHYWTLEGRGSVFSHTPFDLIEKPKRINRTFWFNVYLEDLVSAATSKSGADAVAIEGRVACIPIEIDCAVGEGLDDGSD
jgi:hypothetical protein